MPFTWTPATGCGGTPSGAGASYTSDMAVGSIEPGDDVAVTSKFKLPDARTLDLVARDRSPACSFAAWRSR